MIALDAMRPRVLRAAGQKELPGLERLQAPIHRRDHLLVGQGPGADDAGGQIHPFIVGREDEQVVGRLDDRLDAPATEAGQAAEDDADFLGLDQSTCLLGEDLEIGSSVGDHPFDFPAPNAAFPVDLLEHHDLRVYHRLLADRQRTGQRVQDSNPDRLFECARAGSRRTPTPDPAQ